MKEAARWRHEAMPLCTTTTTTTMATCEAATDQYIGTYSALFAGWTPPPDGSISDILLPARLVRLGIPLSYCIRIPPRRHAADIAPVWGQVRMYAENNTSSLLIGYGRAERTSARVVFALVPIYTDLQQTAVAAMRLRRPPRIFAPRRFRLYICARGPMR